MRQDVPIVKEPPGSSDLAVLSCVKLTKKCLPSISDQQQDGPQHTASNGKPSTASPRRSPEQVLARKASPVTQRSSGTPSPSSPRPADSITPTKPSRTQLIAIDSVSAKNNSFAGFILTKCLLRHREARHLHRVLHKRAGCFTTPIFDLERRRQVRE